MIKQSGGEKNDTRNYKNFDKGGKKNLEGDEIQKEADEAQGQNNAWKEENTASEKEDNALKAQGPQTVRARDYRISQVTFAFVLEIREKRCIMI